VDQLGWEGNDIEVVGGGAQVQSPVEPSGVVVLGVLSEDSPCVLLVVDQQPVGALGSDGAYEPLCVGIHPRRLRRTVQDLDVVGGGDRVERLGVSAVAVAQQVAEAVPLAPGENPNDMVASASFAPLVAALNGLRSHDERLVEQLASRALSRGSQERRVM
jgi:hypothetical protein